MERSQGVPISIQLRTKVTQQGEHQDFYFDLKGQMVKIGDTLYIRYKEIQEELADVPVTIKILPDGNVQLIRAGEMRMRLKFAYRERLETSYRTPYGMIQVDTFTKKLHVSLKDRPTAGKVMIDYDLFMGLEKIGEYELRLDFTA
ncbi:DUF1934 domain-containing protein [Enterococcus hirae]|nr:DUF1934 domain-containing protein [Enterococcus sp. 10A9_DIV0425]THE09898.1 DUF1934 domain-containing protein [Enterococcus hirae]